MPDEIDAIGYKRGLKGRLSKHIPSNWTEP